MDLEHLLARGITLLFGLFISGVVAYIATRWVRDTANRLQLVDLPNHRSSHTLPTPRLGGIAIICGVFVTIAGFQLLQAIVPKLSWMIDQPDPWMLVGAMMVAAVGIYDDLKGVSAWGKLGVQVCAALVLILGGFRFDLGGFAGLGGTPAMELLTMAVTLVWIVGVINAVNLIDGLDGLAAGIAIIAITALTVISALKGVGSDLVLVSVLLGALFGFLYFNRHPATIFMGDSGSLFLGYLLAAFALPVTGSEGAGFAFFPVIVVLSVPLLDTSLSIIRRAASGRGLMTADRDHVHHKLREKIGLSHRDAVIYLYGFSAFCAFLAVGYTLPTSGPAQDLGICGLWGAAVLFLTCRLGYLPKRLSESKVVTGFTRHPWVKKTRVG